MGTVAEQVRFEHEPCATCGAPIEAIAPSWYTLRIDQVKGDRGRVRWRYAPDETARCFRCDLEAQPPDAREARWRDLLEPLQSWKAGSNLPSSATLYHHRTANVHVHSPVNGTFQFEDFFCHVRGRVPDAWRIPRRVIAPNLALNNGTEPLTLLYVGSRIRLDGVSAYIDLNWDVLRPETEGTLQVMNWLTATYPDLDRLMHGAQTFVKNLSRGRKRGGTTHTRHDVEVLLRAYVAERGNLPKRKEFFAYAGIPKPTWDRYMRAWGTSFKVLLRDM